MSGESHRSTQRQVDDSAVAGHRECGGDPAYRDCPAEQLVAAAAGTNRSYLMIVDRETISHPEHPLLIVDLFEQPTRSFRAVPSATQAVENNLSLANMDFEEFAEAVDGDGIFRDFFTH